MVELLGTIANDADYVPSHLHALGQQVGLPEDLPGESWGIGYYGDDRALIIRKPRHHLETRSLYALAPQVRSRVVLASRRRSGPLDTTPPLRFRRWLFVPAGDLSPLSRVRDRVVDRLPDFVRSEIGDADEGQLAFAMFASELHRSGILVEDPHVPLEAVGRALARTADTVDRLSLDAGGPPSRFSFAATRGRTLMAVGWGQPLCWREQVGLEALPDGPPDPALTEFKRIAAALKRFRAITVTEGSSPGWTALADRALFTVDAHLQVAILLSPVGA